MIQYAKKLLLAFLKEIAVLFLGIFSPVPVAIHHTSLALEIRCFISPSQVFRHTRFGNVHHHGHCTACLRTHCGDPHETCRRKERVSSSARSHSFPFHVTKILFIRQVKMWCVVRHEGQRMGIDARCTMSLHSIGQNQEMYRIRPSSMGK